MVVKASIGMPVYNGAATMTTAINSLLSQSYSNFELVISDNGSTDATEEIARAFVAADPRVRYHKQPQNLGAVANFEDVFARTSGDFFMWAAADDVRDPSWLSKAVAALEQRPDAVLAASDIAMCHDINTHGQPGCLLSYHQLTEGIEADRPHIRYRTIVRHGGWSATYGLIRRQAMQKTRRLADMRDLPSLGIAADYRLIELCLQGPFAYIREPLLVNQVRERTQADLTTYLLPASEQALPPTSRSSLWWQFSDAIWLGQNYDLPTRDKIALVAEYLKSLRRPGTLHTHMLNRNAEAALSSRKRWHHFLLWIERTFFLATNPLDLLIANRALAADLRRCQADLTDRTRRLEKHIADYGPEI